MPLSQIVAAIYATTVSVVLQPSQSARSQLPRTVGIGGALDCNQCDDLQKQELGGCPFWDSHQKGTVPSCIDFTGDDDRDLIWVCPLGVRIQEPAVALDVMAWNKITVNGGPEARYGPGLGHLPARVTEALTMLAALEQRYINEIKRTRAEMDRNNG